MCIRKRQRIELLPEEWQLEKKKPHNRQKQEHFHVGGRERGRHLTQNEEERGGGDRIVGQ